MMMAEGLLSQEEIDALLKGAGAVSGGGGELTEEQLEVLNEVFNVLTNSVISVFSMLFNKEMEGNVESLEEVDHKQVGADINGNGLLYVFNWDGVVSGPSSLVLTEHDALVISDLMMGGNGVELPPSMNELYLSAVNEALSQLLGSAGTSLAGLVGGTLTVKDSNGQMKEIKEGEEIVSGVSADDKVLRGTLNINISDVGEIKIFVVMPMEVAKAFADAVLATMKPEEEQQQEEPQPQPAAPQPTVSAQAPSQPVSTTAAPSASAAPPAMGAVSTTRARPVEEAAVKPVEFAPVSPGGAVEVPPNIDLVMDIPVRVTVELGRTRKTVKEVLAFAPGAVIELDKLAGEPVDVLVNGKLVARGEVVVVDESFGVRITEIVSPEERLKSMRG